MERTQYQETRIELTEGELLKLLGYDDKAVELHLLHHEIVQERIIIKLHNKEL